MHPRQLTRAIILLLAAMTVLTFPGPILAESGSSPEEPALSLYWNYVVSRWEPIILQEAQRRSLDPDLIAALIWKESRGQPGAYGPAGAVGLMMVMPFPGRPSPEELENPWINVFWGTRALATIVGDGSGDLYYSLAAYNGGWDQIHLRVTRGYATSVLDYYARAIAVRYGLPEDGEWIALFAVEGAPGRKTVIVLGPQRPLARYTERPWGQADILTMPVGVPPHATAITFVDEQGVECRVNVWLVAENGSLLASSTTQTAFASHPLATEMVPGVRWGSSLHSPKVTLVQP